MSEAVERWEAVAADSQLQERAERAWREFGHNATVKLRRHYSDPGVVAAAVGLAQLRERARSKFGADAASMFFTRATLEQATRPAVARRRAERLAAYGGDRSAVSDLCAGLGTESLALARAGLRVRAVEWDPETAWLTRANAAALGWSHSISVERADALEVPLDDIAVADPARRDGVGRRFDPAHYSPALDELLRRLTPLRASAVKVGPGIDHAWIDSVHAEGEWVSYDGTVVEACLWVGDAAAAPRRASVWDGTSWHELSGTGGETAPTSTRAGDFLIEPDGAVIRSGLVSDLARSCDAWTGHPSIAYLYADRPAVTPLARCWRIAERLPFKTKSLARALRERRIGALTIKQRGTGIDPQKLRRELRLQGDRSATVALTRVGDEHVTWLLEYPTSA